MTDRLRELTGRIIYLENEEWNTYLLYKTQYGTGCDITVMQFGRWQALKSLVTEFSLEAK